LKLYFWNFLACTLWPSWQKWQNRFLWKC